MFHHSGNRRYALCLVLGMTALATVSARSAHAAAPAENKTGVVNIQEAIFNTSEGKKEFDALQTRYGPKNNELKSHGEDLEKLKTQLQATGDKLSDDARAAQVKAISDKQKVFQRQAEDFQAEVQQAEQEIMSRLGQKMLKVLEKYAASNGFSVVLDVSNQQTSSVLWASPGSNITKELVDAYNAAYPVSGAPAAKPAGAAKPMAPAPKPAATTTPKKP